MARIQQSIEIKVPAHVAYSKLTQFEDYPRFMEEVEAVQQLDDTHLHWRARFLDRPVEWDAQIIEQEPDRCIAWRNLRGATNAGKVEVQPVGPDASRVTLTMETEPLQATASLTGNSEQQMAQRLKQDLARLKDFIEASGSDTGAWRGEVHGGHVTTRDRDAKGQTGGAVGQETGQAAGDKQDADQPARRNRGSPGNPVPTSGYAAGSEGWAGNEDPSAPVTSSHQNAAQQRNDPAGSVSPPQQPSSSGPDSDRPQESASTQSDYSLSRFLEDGAGDGRFTVSEEVNLDQQSDAARHVGRMPEDSSARRPDGTSVPDAIGKSMQQDKRDK